jgi:DNA-binding transcriptional regulator/RsmH inhibitor MraZ
LEQFGENDTLILMNFGGRIHLYPERFYMSRFGQLRPSVVPTVDELRLMRSLFGSSQRLQWDKQGRILLSPKTMGQFKLDRETTVVCTGDHLELWNRSERADDQAELSKDTPDLIEKMADRFTPLSAGPIPTQP